MRKLILLVLAGAAIAYLIRSRAESQPAWSAAEPAPTDYAPGPESAAEAPATEEVSPGPEENRAEKIAAGEPATFSWKQMLQGGKVESSQLRHFIAARPYLNSSELEPAAKLATDWRRAVDDAAGARELIGEDGDDPELRELLASSEHPDIGKTPSERRPFDEV